MLTATEGFSRIIPTVILVILLNTILIGGLICLFILLTKALIKYLRSGNPPGKAPAPEKPLGEILKGHRLAHKMTQEFVAERLGVSRQAVSKWESGTAVPSTSNLLALAKLYDIAPEELLKSVRK